MRILIADDSLAHVCILSAILQDLRPGLEIRTAADGGETLFALSPVGNQLRSYDEDPDLVLLDLHIPGYLGPLGSGTIPGLSLSTADCSNNICDGMSQWPCGGSRGCYVKPASLAGSAADPDCRPLVASVPFLIHGPQSAYTWLLSVPSPTPEK